MGSFLAVLKSIGGGLLSVILPSLGNKLIGEVNEFLGEPDKINPETATGLEVATAIQSLPIESQVSIAKGNTARELAAIQSVNHLDDNATKVQLALLANEAKGSRTRPITVYAMLGLVVVGILGTIILHGTVSIMIIQKMGAGEAWDATKMAAISNLLPDTQTLMTLLAFPCWVIRSYFHDRSMDKNVQASERAGFDITKPTSLSRKVVDKIFKK